MMRFTLEDFPKLGIRYVTGEACNYSMRELCEVTEETWPLVCEFYGIYGNPRQGLTNGYSSFFLPHDNQLTLLAFLVLRKHEDITRVLVIPAQKTGGWRMDSTVIGLDDSEGSQAQLERLISHYNGNGIQWTIHYKDLKSPHRGSLNYSMIPGGYP